MDSSKARLIAVELDTARCKGDWQAIPELAKRYKKCRPNESVLETTVCVESDFIAILRQVRNEYLIQPKETTESIQGNTPQNQSTHTLHESGLTSSTSLPTSKFKRSASSKEPTGQIFSFESNRADIDYVNDSPHLITIQPRLTISQVQSCLKRLETVVQRHAKTRNLESPDDWQAQFSKIIVARIYCESGRYTKALEALKKLALPLDDVNAGYGLVLLVQARVIKGFCFEMEGDVEAALACYNSAWDVASKHLTEKNESLSFWVEECLYRTILLRLRVDAPIEEILSAMRGYVQMVSTHWPVHWRIHKRWIIFRHTARYLTQICQEDNYIPAPTENSVANDTYVILVCRKLQQALSHIASIDSSIESEHSKEKNNQLAFQEFCRLTKLFRNLLTSLQLYLNPRMLSYRVSELVDIIMEGHRIIGWGSNSDVQRVNQFLCDVKEMTFNNPGVMRHKFFVLIRLGEFEEALYSLRSYAELIGLPDIDKTDYDSSESDQTTAIKISPADKAALIQTRLDALSAVEGDVGWNSDSHASKENEMNVLSVLLAGAQLYGREYKSGILAATVSELALTLYQRVSLVRSNDNNILAQCYLVRGVSLCLLAIQSCDENTRSANFTESIALLKASVKAAPSSWRAYYELSLAQAQTRDIKGASISISKSIELNPEHLPSWHLLALLCSCKQNKSVFESLETIEAGLRECDIDIPTLDIKNIVLSWSGEDKCSRYYFETAESYLTTRMSQILFLETLEGPRSVLKLYPELFTIYSKLSQSLDLSNNAVPTPTLPIPSKKNSLKKVKTDSPKTTSCPSSPTSPRHPRLGTDEQLGLITAISKTSSRPTSPTLPKSPTSPTSLRQSRIGTEDQLGLITPIPRSTSARTQSVTRKRTQSRKASLDYPRDMSEPPLPTDIPVPMSPLLSETETLKAFTTKMTQEINETVDQLSELSVGRGSSDGLPNPKLKPKQRSFMDINIMKRISNSQITLLPANSSVSVAKEAKRESAANHKESRRSGTTVRDLTTVSFASVVTSSYLFGSKNSVSNMHSAYRQVSNTVALDTRSRSASDGSTTFVSHRRERWNMLLMKLWLMVASTYMRAGFIDDAMRVISEVEDMNISSPMIWYQLGVLCIKIDRHNPLRGWDDIGIDSFKKALNLDPEHVETQVALANVYLDKQEPELAEFLLLKTTSGTGWDSAEAWYMLGTIYQKQEKIEQAKCCLFYALELNETTPLCPFSQLPCFV
ncbi:hypothetical protein PHYBLDRAFT_171959 [Phycomyces blakesleeanus NRRL 1555(-)]|uniref:Uncharacterized protein n=1 Tax=Phycomyces blakesleeanus (strain ATCC 8743b / DSM 1359 / FGSC 10004 / NBRC 33097 / NRRL 1555) TaxID=763407 RepID=A0A162PL51_PHYB8|nr:hypothetical protein PHYBLDRAFT_171959 [Phycomyces blakesleeanus NRRL 1555(-)]OAD69936.1 hypothetical protein PHYBLDRAFT_171959 [Phycomyces blakesleeanus NRRL 1555(-)]|eukprot:XP_018287976.1 hypothetical protein PHYBLDRAFT_171959 [Phycomyces blakesleeanus NRRL 1555(-)]